MSDLFGSTRATWTVTELTMAIKAQLEGEFPSVMVEGEISNCRPSGAGHVYFTLKDSGAVISAALFRGRAARVSARPKDGMQAVITGKIDVYPPRGSYQIIVEDVRAAGRGALLEELERRKAALAAEGLFDQGRKQPLPPYPRRIAVVTSPTGAAIQDILRVMERRAASPHVTILPAPVQGMEAPQKIAAQIRRAAAYGLGDVLIVARGGGSLEDLMAFNTEEVARAVAGCPLPVISGVGHEIDVSLADLAADVRAATPSAAAELVSDRSEDLLLRARGFRREAVGLLGTRIDAAAGRMRQLRPAMLAAAAQGRLEESMRRSDEALRDLGSAAADRLAGLRRRLELADRSVREASPRSLLERGSARVMKDGKSVTDASVLAVDDPVDLEFARGAAEARITGLTAPEERKVP